MFIQRPSLRRNNKAPTWLLLVIFGALAFTLLACDELSDDGPIEDDPTTPWVETQYSLMPAESCDAVRERVIAVSLEDVLRYRYSEPMYRLDAEATNAPQADGGGESPTDYTTTNVQEAGVDEVDIVKTDGEYIYTVQQGDLVIVDSWPVAEVSEVGRLALVPNSQDRYSYSPGLFLHGDRVAAFVHLYEYSNNDRPFQGTRIVIVDVSNRAAPTIERSIDIEGYFVDGRMIDGEVYAVANAGINLPVNIWNLTYDSIPGIPEPYYGDDEAERDRLRDQARPILHQHIQAAFAGVDVNDMLPRQRILDADQNIVSEGPLFDCSDLYLPRTVTQLGVLSLAHVSLTDESTFDVTGLLANGWQLYASQDNLYVALSSRWWWWGWGSFDAETHIHKFGLNGPDDHPQYVASGKVDGWIYDQFAMSEYQGNLRVASTDNTWTWDPTTQTSANEGGNHVTVLAQQGGLLEEIGSLRNLAPGEQIFACRMMGERGYLVTFQQTDPLFTIDLSDPTNPELQGELHINGFSSYIHPLGENHLLTIGQDADDAGNVSGVHLQLFDVSDMNNPTRTFQEKISTGSWSSWSEAMWDHHAFTYHPVREVLAIPINIYEWDNANGENFSGLLLYNVNATDGFSEIGRVNHADLVTQAWCHSSGEEWNCTPENDYQWWTTVRRSIFIEDFVYSLSDVGLKVNELLSPEIQHAALVLNAYW